MGSYSVASSLLGTVPPAYMYMDALGLPELAWPWWSFNFADTENDKCFIGFTGELIFAGFTSDKECPSRSTLKDEALITSYSACSLYGRTQVSLVCKSIVVFFFFFKVQNWFMLHCFSEQAKQEFRGFCIWGVILIMYSKEDGVLSRKIKNRDSF